MNINIVNALTGQRTPCGDECHVEIGSGDETVSVDVIDGVVHISTARTMMINPRTNNVVRVRSVR